MSTLTTTVPHITTSLPGPKARAIIERDGKVVSPSYTRDYPLVIARGEGAVVEDVDGNVFLDCTAGIAVTSTGHCHPRVVSAVTAQAGELLHYSASDFYLPIYSQMCAALAATAPIPGPVRVFLTNSGAEAVEGALKLARAAGHADRTGQGRGQAPLAGHAGFALRANSASAAQRARVGGG